MSVKASFVIPANNAEAWIAETLESVIKQTRKDIEAVVIDDGSTDDTAELVEHYAKEHPQIRLIKLGNRYGRSAARNIGNQEAKGEVILVLDADDISFPNRADETIRFFEANPDKDWFYSSFIETDALGISRYEHKAKEVVPETVKNTLLFGIGHSTLAYRKSVAEKIKYQDGEYSDLGIDDWRFQHDLLKNGLKGGFSEKNLALYRQIPKKRDEKRVKELKEACLAS